MSRARISALSLAELNGLPRHKFIAVIGPAFEDSPWIAQETWLRRPFESFDALHGALCATVCAAGRQRQLSLIRAHPDLVGRAALTGSITAESTREQASAGLDRLTADEAGLFQDYNHQYTGKFGFPFVICARLNRKEAILNGFRLRLQNSREQEIKTALEEIGKIAWLRLKDLVVG